MLRKEVVFMWHPVCDRFNSYFDLGQNDNMKILKEFNGFNDDILTCGALVKITDMKTDRCSLYFVNNVEKTVLKLVNANGNIIEMYPESFENINDNSAHYKLEIIQPM